MTMQREEGSSEAPPPGFGLFASGLLAVSLGLAGFCTSCFVAILGLLLWSHGGAGHPVDFANTYKYVALPVGIAVTLVSGVVLLALWLRRTYRRLR